MNSVRRALKLPEGSKVERRKLIKELKENGCWRLDPKRNFTCGQVRKKICSDCVKAIKILEELNGN